MHLLYGWTTLGYANHFVAIAYRVVQVSYRIGEDGSVGVIYDARANSESEENSGQSSPVAHRLTPSPDSATVEGRLSPDATSYQYLGSVIAARAS